MEGQSVFSTNCQKCGRIIYEGEMLNIKGRYVCESCANMYIFERPDMPAKRRRVPSAFFHFIFSLHPGAGHMYLGLMKKGLFQMCLFYFAIYLTAFMPNFFGFVIPIICIYSFFDSLTLRRRLVNGELLSDDLYSEKSFFNRNMGLIAIVIFIMLAVSVIGGAVSIFRSSVSKGAEELIESRAISRSIKRGTREITTFYYDHNGKSPKNLVKPVLLTGLGGLIVYNVVKNRKRTTAPKDDENWTYKDTASKD